MFLNFESLVDKRAFAAKTPISSHAIKAQDLPLVKAKKAPMQIVRVTLGPTGKLSYTISSEVWPVYKRHTMKATGRRMVYDNPDALRYFST